MPFSSQCPATSQSYPHILLLKSKRPYIHVKGQDFYVSVPMCGDVGIAWLDDQVEFSDRNWKSNRGKSPPGVSSE